MVLVMRRCLIALFICFCLSACDSSEPEAQPTTPPETVEPQLPFPQHVSYAAETIRPSHRSQEQLDDDVRAAYDRWKSKYLVSAGTSSLGGSRYRISFGSGDPGRTVSEGQGYGMVIVALMAGHDPQAQTIFNGLWDFAKAHPSASDNRLMGWQVPVSSGNNSAFDGDADIAYGLLLADKQWGSDGAVDYHAAAERVIAGMLESMIGPASRLPMLGDWVNPNGNPHSQYTPRSSDFMPAHFRAYGRATNNATWLDVVEKSQAVINNLQGMVSAQTGLLPDFIVTTAGSETSSSPAAPDFLEGPNDGNYYYNAGRVPWRLGTDALLNNDAVSMAQTRKIATWIAEATGGQPSAIKPGYQLDGTPIPPGNYFTSFFAAPFGVAAMTTPGQQAWLNDVYDAVRSAEENYYEDTVTLLCLLVMTGNYWDPTTIVAN